MRFIGPDRGIFIHLFLSHLFRLTISYFLCDILH
jgi:hypothetical protein